MDIARIKELTAKLEFHRHNAAFNLGLFNKQKQGRTDIFVGDISCVTSDECGPMLDASLDYLQLMCELHQKRAFELMNEIVALMPESLRD
jgi:hypothetical protein